MDTALATLNYGINISSNPVTVSFSLWGAKPTDSRFWGANAKFGPGPATGRYQSFLSSREMISVNYASCAKVGQSES